MHWLRNRIPPPLIASLCGLLMWLGARQWPSDLALSLGWRLSLALPLLLLGIGVCLAGVLSFRRARTTVNPLRPESASALVNTGIYRHTRNPMYLGFAIMLLAWSLFLAWPAAGLGVMAFVLYINYLQILPEERALRGLFGEDFARYCDALPIWL